MQRKSMLLDIADSLVKKIYKKTLDFPYKFQSSIGDQMRRASLSVVLNLVEGGARLSDKEKRQFLNITFSSLKETKYLLYFAKEHDLFDESLYQEIMDEINQLARLIYGILYKKSNV